MSRRRRIERTRLAREAAEARARGIDPRMKLHGVVLRPIANPYAEDGAFRLAPIDPDRVRPEPDWYFKDFNLGEAGE